MLAAKHCKNLQHLNLAGSPGNLRMLSTVCRNLRVLKLDGCSPHDRNLHTVFQQTLNLETLTLSNNSYLTGQCLSALAHAPLKELVMDGCTNLQSHSLVNGLLVLKRLSRLSLNSCRNLTSSDVQKIMGAVPRLQSLSMENHFPLFTSTTLKALDKLHDLISLNLQLNVAVNDQILIVITRSCRKIEELNISGYRKLFCILFVRATSLCT